ncbi:GNAT family N-acetyltransferase [Paucibacter sp. B2R-40]|jgi:GNAT superfamily N-acetyltransferase|uniref:GNAT family N-acetyltransferase n=1 Tax=Paucibacter sp. B2R-40 TaxID=2893554 RepID=UPI0021E42C34|nr:GNAT family N-acetyltransferase [Paucibacter sp. B2R-40]MCV2355289.1 GNAT family N-acetyltransferase [Paucibacter sp. B2R-40]
MNRVTKGLAMTNEQQLFEAYRADRQDHDIEGFRLEVLPHLRRYLPHSDSADAEALLCFSRLSAGQEAGQIREQIDYFEARRQNFEWKLYGFEQPAALKQLLEAQGFVADEPELFMLYPLLEHLLENTPAKASANVGLPAGVSLRRIVDPLDLDDVLTVQAQVWGRDFEWLRAKLAASLHKPEDMSMFCAYADGQPIGTGWTDYPPGSRFPELHGGSVLPAWRGRGVYSALFNVRFNEARARGFEWMAVDASLMSRPILEAIGFKPICQTWPMRYRCRPQPASR